MMRSLKSAAQLCVFVVASSILLVPVQAAETVPIPAIKPIMLDAQSRAPIPAQKPIFAGAVKPKTFKLTSLFKPLKTAKTKEVKSYPHGFKPLSSKQSKLYQQIFDVQRKADFEQADHLIESLKDERLMGHVLYQRYMHPAYTSSCAELESWLTQYMNHPRATKIYSLARAKAPNASKNLKHPKKQRILPQMRESSIVYAKRYTTTQSRTRAQKKKVQKFSRKIVKLVRKGKALEAAKTLRDSEERGLMDTVEQDKLQAKVAAGFLYRGRVDAAYKLAADAANRSGTYAPHSAWIAGLASWQKGEYEKAVLHFEKVGSSEYASGWLSSAGYFWAARAHAKTGKGPKYSAALNNAAAHTHTFYGLMAASLLGQTPDLNWDNPDYTPEHQALILSKDAGKHAFDLVAAGQYNLAEQELMRLRYKKNPALREAVLAYAVRTNLPRITSRLGSKYNSAMYPDLPWEPKGSYKLDPALIHAIIRQESRYDQNAKSHSGALGLMQIMPKTAKYVAQKRGYAQMPNKQNLQNPEYNMTLGQDYVEYLLKNRLVKGDVVSMLISYNAGPGNLQKWRKRIGAENDPLLFIEMLPVHETRDYVERVLANYWIYRSREHADLPSLAALAQGQSPSYALVTRAKGSDYTQIAR